MTLRLKKEYTFTPIAPIPEDTVSKKQSVIYLPYIVEFKNESRVLYCTDYWEQTTGGIEQYVLRYTHIGTHGWNKEKTEIVNRMDVTIKPMSESHFLKIIALLNGVSITK